MQSAGVSLEPATAQFLKEQYWQHWTLVSFSTKGAGL